MVSAIFSQNKLKILLFKTRRKSSLKGNRMRKNRDKQQKKPSCRPKWLRKSKDKARDSQNRQQQSSRWIKLKEKISKILLKRAQSLKSRRLSDHQVYRAHLLVAWINSSLQLLRNQSRRSSSRAVNPTCMVVKRGGLHHSAEMKLRMKLEHQTLNLWSMREE